MIRKVKGLIVVMIIIIKTLIMILIKVKTKTVFFITMSKWKGSL